MLFPCPMLRLTWFLPESRLYAEIERLASTGVFHLSDHVRLGRVTQLHELKTAYREFHRARWHRRGRELLEKLPVRTLLNYRFGQLPPERVRVERIRRWIVRERGDHPLAGALIHAWQKQRGQKVV